MTQHYDNAILELKLEKKMFDLQQKMNRLQCYIDQKIQEIVKKFYKLFMNYDSDEKYHILTLILENAEIAKILKYKYEYKLPRFEYKIPENILDKNDPMIQFKFIDIDIDIDSEYEDIKQKYIEKCYKLINNDEFINNNEQSYYDKIKEINTVKNKFYKKYKEIYNYFLKKKEVSEKEYNRSEVSEKELQKNEKNLAKINLILDTVKKSDNKTIEDNPEDIVLIDDIYKLYNNFIKLNVYHFIIHFLQNIQENDIFNNIINEYIKYKKEYDIAFKQKNVKGGKKSRKTKNKNSKKRSYTKRR